MSCASCGRKKKAQGYDLPAILETPPLGANDIQVLDDGKVRRFQADDWTDNTHKLLLFYPETFTPVCQSEMGNLNQWVDKFKELNCDVFSITADPIHAVEDWHKQEPDLSKPQYKALSSYILPTRLGIMNNGKVKRASVFITNDGQVVVHEHFMKVGRSLSELHRTLYAYTTDSYCAEGWNNPQDGFLNADNKKN